MGNFLTYGNVKVTGLNGLTTIMDIEIDTTTGDFRSGRLIPIKQVKRGIPVYDNKGESIELIAHLSKTDLNDTNLVIEKDGTIRYLPIEKAIKQKAIADSIALEEIKAAEELKKAEEENERLKADSIEKARQKAIEEEAPRKKKKRKKKKKPKK